MKLGHKNLEWFIIAVLVIITITIYLMFPAAQLQLGPEVITQTVTNIILLLIFAAQLVTIIVILRVFGKLEETLEHHRTARKK